MPSKLAALCMFCAALLAVQCSKTGPATDAARPLRVGIDLWAGYYPLILAEEHGYLKQRGVQVDVQIPKDTDRMLAQFAAGEIDAVGVSLADVITLTHRVDDLRLVLLSDESSGADQLLAKQPLTGAEQIRGKTISTNLGGFGELFVGRFLQRHDLGPDDVKIVNLDAAAVPRQLQSGAIDIAHTWEPYASQAMAAGAVVLFTSKETPGLIMDGVIFRGDVLERRGAEVRQFVAAWFDAVDWWRAHPAEGERIVEKRLGLQAGEAAPAGIRLLDRETNRQQMLSRDGGPAPLHLVADAYVEFFVARNLLSRRPVAARLVDGSFLP